LIRSLSAPIDSPGTQLGTAVSTRSNVALARFGNALTSSANFFGASFCKPLSRVISLAGSFMACISSAVMNSACRRA
jgi:hypothetical protein